MHQEIILRNLETPGEEDIHDDIDWVCKSFGFVTSRDKDETAAKVLQAIVHAMAKKKSLSSEQLASHCDVSRAAVLHHLRNYMASGLVIPDHHFYILRTRSVTRTVEEVEFDAIRIFAKLKKIAREIDQGLGLE